MIANDTVIVVIDDELPIRRFLRASLSAEGYRIVEADSADAGIRAITQERPSLVILDLGLPDRDGMEVITQVREWSSVPIIILSAREVEGDKIKALDKGANDYLTKPFGAGELLARVRVCLRTAARVAEQGGPEQTNFSFGDIEVDLLARTVSISGEKVPLTKIEFDLLRVFVKNAGRVMTHSQLLKEVWGPNATHEHHYVRIFVANLRKKLEKDPTRPVYLLTEQGVGYRLVTDSKTID